ncbi:hypothetical protein [Alistipes sp. ZOR0009]|uniref:hypothetical protein n=1 Tax=Alistipes sp. ZOR0009 TaxID=1339253 RepID=UPI0006481893|nr:hypothetical protein [Alistipes sp. ZOR0009]
MKSIIENKSILVGFSINSNAWENLSKIDSYTVQVCINNSKNKIKLDKIKVSKICILKTLVGIRIKILPKDIDKLNDAIKVRNDVCIQHFEFILWNNGFVQSIAQFTLTSDPNNEEVDKHFIPIFDDTTAAILNGIKSFTDKLEKIKILNIVKPLYFSNIFLLDDDEECQCMDTTICKIPIVNQKSAISSYHILNNDTPNIKDRFELTDHSSIHFIKGCHLYEWDTTNKELSHEDLAFDFVSNSKCSLYFSKIKTAKSIARNKVISKQFHVTSSEFRDLLTGILDVENGLELHYFYMSTNEREITKEIDEKSFTKSRMNMAKDAENNMYNLLKTIDDERNTKQGNIIQGILLLLSAMALYGVLLQIKELNANSPNFFIKYTIITIIVILILCKFLFFNKKKFKIRFKTK